MLKYHCNSLSVPCVASVSNRVIARKLEQEQKKKGRRTREETLVTQATPSVINLIILLTTLFCKELDDYKEKFSADHL